MSEFTYSIIYLLTGVGEEIRVDVICEDVVELDPKVGGIKIRIPRSLATKITIIIYIQIYPIYLQPKIVQNKRYKEIYRSTLIWKGQHMSKFGTWL